MRSCNHRCSGKAICVTYCKCVFLALVIQHARLMCHLYCLLWHLRLPSIIPLYLINGTVLGKKLLLINVCSYFLYSFYLKQFSLQKNRRYVIINVYRFSCKVPLILLRLSWNLNFLDRFSKNTPMCNFIKIRPVGPAMFCADRDRNRKMERRMDGQT